MKDKAKAKIEKWIKARYRGFEIATHCGISNSVVSRILNDREGVSPESIRKVLEAPVKIGYQEKV